MRIEDGAYAHVVLPDDAARHQLDDRDRAFVTDLVYGTVRSQRRLDDLRRARVVEAAVRRLDPPVRAALRLGAFQLCSGVPAHAAVGETVEALVGPLTARAGFVNGVLRGITRLGRALAGAGRATRSRSRTPTGSSSASSPSSVPTTRHAALWR